MMCMSVRNVIKCIQLFGQFVIQIWHIQVLAFKGGEKLERIFDNISL